MTEDIDGRFNDRRARDEEMLAKEASDSVQAIAHEQLAKIHTDKARILDGGGRPDALDAEPPSNLALAVIAASTAPLLLLDGDCTVLAASRSFYRAFQLNPADVADRDLEAVGNGEWASPQLDALLRATASGHAEVAGYEMELQRQGQEARHLVINAQRLDDDRTGTVRLLLSISDLTDALLAEKSKDDLIREKTILLEEIQHRVANSLQIIASVLIQSARRVDSEEVWTCPGKVESSPDVKGELDDEAATVHEGV